MTKLSRLIKHGFLFRTYAATNVPTNARPIVTSSDDGGCSAAGVVSLSFFLGAIAVVVVAGLLKVCCCSVAKKIPICHVAKIYKLAMIIPTRLLRNLTVDWGSTPNPKSTDEDLTIHWPWHWKWAGERRNKINTSNSEKL